MSIQDETGSGALEFKKLGEKAASEHMWFSARPATSSDSKHVEQLLIDLRQAHEENKQLREDLARAIEKANKSYSNFGVALLLSIVLSNAIWMALGFLSK